MNKKRVIIAIHGLDKKPPRWLLKHWWKKSIREGLKNINKSKYFLKFKMVYWADILHPRPLSLFIFNKKSPLYMDEPYKKSSRNKNKKRFIKLKAKLLNKFEEITDAVFFRKSKLFNLDIISDAIVKLLFEDLDAYYNTKGLKGNLRIKDEICNRLKDQINRYKDYKILLIAHSMGSIIAYDTLSYYTPGAEIDTFVTIGSPLGMPFVIKNILKEQNKTYEEGMLLDTPESIGSAWFNLSDLDDKVALIYRLSNNYKHNSKNIKPVDIIVQNDYEYKNNRNPHKSYGYLRTPELAEIICDFLSP